MGKNILCGDLGNISLQTNVENANLDASFNCSMPNWILVLMEYIYRMVCWQWRTMRTNRVKFVLKVAAGLEEKEGVAKIVDTKEESGEDFARKILEI